MSILIIIFVVMFASLNQFNVYVVYRDSYLRFSSQMFSLSNYHESVHLTNNAVQSRYKNNNERDKALPDENMWDCLTFKAYLK